ncbi:hypothetical protein BKA56DRAFT_499542 [Ilyonectria sp. MPI-CAGE-AT-0026]|nr:hypothetical protein BKA56DRAFT_499542 [Ilyonectria sp. MPI-CAGE-AT-0026]
MIPDSTDLTPAGLKTQEEKLINGGFPPARLAALPTKVLGVNTRTFTYGGPQPTSNPDLTIWALGNALKTCSNKVLDLIDLSKPVRQLEIRMRPKVFGQEKRPCTVTFNGSQNADALLRHLFGDDREPSQHCVKCREGKGALVGCVVTKGIESCANCDWNRSGPPCSLCPRMYLNNHSSIHF